jgi:hypothetical protein
MSRVGVCGSLVVASPKVGSTSISVETSRLAMRATRLMVPDCRRACRGACSRYACYRLRMKHALAVMIAALPACSGQAAAPPAGETTKSAAMRCAAAAAELKTFLASVVDPAGTPARPWPTGDAAADHRIEQVRALTRQEVSAAASHADPAARATRLTVGTTPGRLEHELATCPPALARFARIGEVPPAERWHAFADVADGVRACDCKLDLPLTRAMLYIMQRGPD